MNKYMIYLNSKRCIGCHGCEVHCKSVKGLPVGPFLCEIDHKAVPSVKGFPKTEFTFRSCYHCDNPLCVPICPTDAMIKRADGIVYIDQEKCIGCMACATACPWAIPEMNPDTNKAVKCDYCMDRVDAGLKPACVTKCTTHALKFVTMQEV
ncbi:MAG: 4Fe-4S dicluster domain-containing protein [Proteobacteria bacterium]|nr:4Fe-4S dicluster domain-containing protein [Pseudomonadota bacterium]MBU1056714.1 4Fe-4S dicluster domain-containing protein [Pseudomonadota bacterium]